MKIRNGFISNSSSTSFVILGVLVIKKEQLKIQKSINKNFNKKYMCIGKGLSEGLDVFELNDEMIEFLLKDDDFDNNHLVILELIMCTFEDAGDTESISNFSERVNYILSDKNSNHSVQIHSGHSDYGSTVDIETFKMRYLPFNCEEKENNI